MKPIQVDPNKITVTEIRLLESHINSTKEFLRNPITASNFNINIGQNTGLILEKDVYAVKLDIILSGLNSDGNEIGLTARFVIHFGFLIEGLKDFVKGHNEVDATLAVTIISIAFSTSRGIVLEKTQGTFLNGVILPVINPAEILNPPQIQEANSGQDI